MSTNDFGCFESTSFSKTEAPQGLYCELAQRPRLIRHLEHRNELCALVEFGLASPTSSPELASNVPFEEHYNGAETQNSSEDDYLLHRRTK